MRNLLFILFVFVSSTLMAQEKNVEYFFAGQITNYETGKKEGSVTATLMSGGKVVSSAMTATNGKYVLSAKMTAKSNFEVVFSKPGFVSKRIQYNFKDMNTERLKEGDRLTPNEDLSLELFTVKPTIDFSFLEKEPVAIFDLDENKVVPKLDITANQRMKQKIEGLLTNPTPQPDNKDANYNAAIKSGDNLFNQKKYPEALKQYEVAAGIKPKEFYPQKKIAEIDALTKAQKDEKAAVSEVDNQYNNLVKAADNFRDNGQYPEAIAKYNAALRVKYEQYPKDEIKKLEDMVAATKKAEREDNSYQEAIAAADVAFNAKNYEIAEDRYKEAIAIKSSEKYPQDQLVKVQAELKKQEEATANQKKFEETMNAGNQLFAQSKFEEAKIKFVEASVLLPKETLPKEKIKSCDEMIAKNALASKTENDINRLFEEGQKLIDSKSYTAAKGKYSEIIALDPKKTLAYVKIDDIDRIIKAEEDAKNADKIIKGYVTEGDLAVKEERYDEAKMKYGAALEVKEDPALREKYNALLAKIANKQAKDLVDQKFEEKMKAAKLLLDAEKYAEARTAYQACANLDEKREEPKLRLAEIDAKLSKISEADKTYRSYIEKGDNLVKNEKYLAAIDEYNKAISLRPTEIEPKEKADEAERLEREKGDIANQQFEKIISTAKTKIEEKDFDKATELLNRAINLRSPERKTDKRPEEMLAEIDRLKRIDISYQEKITSGEKLANEKKYDLAILKFEEAAKIKTSEALPNQRIDELKKLQSEMLGHAEKESLFNESYQKGVAAKTAKTYEVALDNFKKASNYKPDNQVVKDQIAEIEQILDDRKKLENSDKERREKLVSMLKVADDLFDLGDWGEAKKSYESIVEFDKNQAHAKARITECDLKLNAEMSKTANEEYKALIASADNKFEQKDFQRSKELFSSALEKRPSDPYPKKRLQDLNLLMNPVVVKSSILKPLGDVYTGADGAADLAQADIERENDKQNGFSSKVNASIAKMDQERNDEKLENFGTKDGIEKVKSRSDQEAILAKEKLALKNEEIKKIGSFQRDVELQNQLFEQGDNYNAQASIHSKESKVSEIQDFQSQSYKQNAEKMTSSTSRINSQKDNMNNEYTAKNIQGGKDLAQMSIDAQNKMNDDESRRETQVQIEQSQANLTKNSDDYLNNQTSKIQETAKGIKETKEAQVQKTTTEIKRLEVNTDAIKTIESKMIDEQRIAYNHEMEIYLKTKEQITDQEKVSVRKNKESTDKINTNNRKIRDLTVNLANDSDKKVVDDSQTNIAGQLDLNAIQKRNNQTNVENATKENDNILIIEAKKDVAVSKENSLGDKAVKKNLNSRSDIETLISENADKSFRSTEKQMKNSKMVSEMENITRTQTENNSNKTIENQQALTEKLNKVNTNPEKVTARNTLGEEFPEGVTEEKFSQNGPDGKLKSIITRRVVVIDGHGDVYIRTQTNGVSTYKKNDKPINEYTWQKETQNSSLVRH